MSISTDNDLYLLAINLTRRCNLACAHCYLDADTLQHGSADELTTEEVCRLLDEVAACGDGPMVVLTGGEPLVRKDLEKLVSHGAGLGLAMVVGTNGMMLTARRVAALKQAGLMGAGISLDSLEPDKHDRFRGLPGAWAKTMAGIEQCRHQDLSFQLHFSVTKDNADELQAMIEFACTSGARVFNVFFLVCTGRGKLLTDLTPQRYEQVLEQLIEVQAKYPDLIIRPRCAPWFKRIAHQHAPRSQLNRISGQEGDGCIAGTHYCRVTPEGDITPCPYISNAVGNIRKQSFSTLWQHSPVFEQLRNPVLQGNCGVCEYRKLCGGCRARPLAMGGALMDADPWCHYTPQGGSVIEPFQNNEHVAIVWSPRAEQRLARIPAFLRNMIRKRAEAYVAELGEQQVTPEHLAELSARRFGSNLPFKRPSI